MIAIHGSVGGQELDAGGRREAEGLGCSGSSPACKMGRDRLQREYHSQRRNRVLSRAGPIVESHHTGDLFAWMPGPNLIDKGRTAHRLAVFENPKLVPPFLRNMSVQEVLNTGESVRAIRGSSCHDRTKMPNNMVKIV